MPPPARRRLLFVHAHPDDETLSTGGTLARYAAEPDTAVTLVTCTLGEQGEVIPAELAELAPDRGDQLGGYRAGELAAACDALGVGDHRYLGGIGRWRDSGMALAGHGVRAAMPQRLHPRALARPDAFDEQVDQLVAVMEELRPQVVVTYGPDGGYGHPDHVRAHDITAAAVRRVPARMLCTVVGRSTLDAGLAKLAGRDGLPFRMPEPDELPSVPDEEIRVRVDVSAQRAARVAAMRAHATQVAVWQDGEVTAFAVSNFVAQPLLDVEEFVPADGVSMAAHDLFGETVDA
ncbi:N-acetyl-1-D-myo-inositol-2-amino-2-deoxy-alpha-D-glucopyranoside deacetylase [Pseudonocardia sp. DSM 110487]|uniref:N-acetyl-1-D-myo-inositol-2-amino-2-deoxy-alpha- D-glucopyranoside deacetylase n=1 Tax=Pseudonocardia sp. DSM 110487 TaxID=2865833 RepID=UPI001C6973B1|nr:N-acetyl-1-D-myo-inositol-2-amino-2-deoxy-alpha-D-glucopyranoside deacetylase [Pseudonocardia sp. DSM 110487]QYN40047.1 N-acetyl-1-D-myo-inositol-2-amino-2-deoxy-alpha-D-glucopyranoside deacetylase [Pseudonocardia sp. DSM 110487]